MTSGEIENKDAVARNIVFPAGHNTFKCFKLHITLRRMVLIIYI